MEFSVCVGMEEGQAQEQYSLQCNSERWVHVITLGNWIHIVGVHSRLCYESYKSNEKKANQIKEWMMSTESVKLKQMCTFKINRQTNQCRETGLNQSKACNVHCKMNVEITWGKHKLSKKPNENARTV